MHRGSGTHSKGDKIYMIETIYKDHSMFKIFASESGLKAGLRAVDYEISRARTAGWEWYAQDRKVYTIDNPQWEEV